MGPKPSHRRHLPFDASSSSYSSEEDGSSGGDQQSQLPTGKSPSPTQVPASAFSGQQSGGCGGDDEKGKGCEVKPFGEIAETMVVFNHKNPLPSPPQCEEGSNDDDKESEYDSDSDGASEDSVRQPEMNPLQDRDAKLPPPKGAMAAEGSVNNEGGLSESDSGGTSAKVMQHEPKVNAVSSKVAIAGEGSDDDAESESESDDDDAESKSDDDDEESESDDDDDLEVKAPPSNVQVPLASKLVVEGSKDEAESKSDDKEAEENSPIAKVGVSLPPKEQAKDGSDDTESDSNSEGSDQAGESEVNERSIKTIFQLPLPPQGEESSDDSKEEPQGEESSDDSEEEEDSESESEEESSRNLLPRAKGNVPSSVVAGTSQLKRKAAATELTKSPSPKKKQAPALQGNAAAAATEFAKSCLRKRNTVAAELHESPSPRKGTTAAATWSAPSKKPAARIKVTKTPPVNKAAANTKVAKVPFKTTTAKAMIEVAAAPGAEEALPHPQESESDAEKHFKEKSETYCYLWQMVLTLEKQHSLLFKEAFLKIQDTKANTLNTKIKKMYVQDLKQLSLRKKKEMDVIKELIKLS